MSEEDKILETVSKAPEGIGCTYLKSFYEADQKEYNILVEKKESLLLQLQEVEAQITALAQLMRLGR